MTKKPKVLFVVEYYFPHIGGVEFLFQSVAEYLVEQGYEVGVVTARVNGGAARENLNGVKIYRTWVPKRGARYFFTFFGLFWVLPIARKYDIIHTTTYNAAVPGSLAGLLLRKKVILTVHEVWIRLWHKLPGASPKMLAVLKTFEQAILSLPYAHFVCVSHATEKELLAYKPKLKGKTTTIYNGIDYKSLPVVTKSTPKESSQKTVLYFGRPGISKGVENLIAACNECTNKNLHFRLIVSKDEDMRYNFLKGLITNENIVMEPSLPRQQLFQAMSDADYVIIPSLSEGFGFAALEASIYSRKLISSDQGSLPEVVFGNAELYDPWDPKVLTKLLNTIDTLPFKHIPEKKFPIQETAEAYAKLY